MKPLQQTLNEEINSLPLMSQKEVLDFVLFLKHRLTQPQLCYRLEELLAQCDETAELSTEESEWLQS